MRPSLAQIDLLPQRLEALVWEVLLELRLELRLGDLPVAVDVHVPEEGLHAVSPHAVHLRVSMVLAREREQHERREQPEHEDNKPRPAREASVEKASKMITGGFKIETKWFPEASGGPLGRSWGLLGPSGDSKLGPISIQVVSNLK